MLDYYWAGSEFSSGTQNPTQYSGGTLRSWLSSNPYMKFNLVHGDKYSCNWTNNGWKKAMKAFYGIAGNTFVNQYRFKELLNQKVGSLSFIESIPD